MVLAVIVRRLHRWLSIAAAVLVLYVAVTGLMMAVDNVYGSVYLAVHGQSFPAGVSGPPAGLEELLAAGRGSVADADMPSMLRATLAAARKSDSSAPPPRVIRLRNYAGMRQGVIVTGDEPARQLVFDTGSGRQAGLYESGYPKTPFPFQWGTHETWKRLHRGDVFGLTGRWIDLLSGLAILFLAVSGSMMYLQVYRARKRTGRRSLFWR
jgi:hypothetical protein